MMKCANCAKELRQGETTGESGIYSPHESFTLCEDCFLAEDALITELGSNNLPDRLEHYRYNQQGRKKT